MFIADVHIHSKYSMATSRGCSLENIEHWARKKGLGLVGTGDFTHPEWRADIERKLCPLGNGLFGLKREYCIEAGQVIRPSFIISGEISCVYKDDGKTRRVHNIILLPGIEEAASLSSRLEAIGKLHSDGRPILKLSSRDLLEITLEVCGDAIFIPAHIWTPHYSLFGSYESIDGVFECFGDLSKYIYALETGLSANPPMIWRLSTLDRFSLISNSDAHSPQNLAREASIFNAELSYSGILRALKSPDTDELAGTIEFFPEEGKYYLDGHRSCGVCQNPPDTMEDSGRCPVCGRKLTVGVLHRIGKLADREVGYIPAKQKNFESLVPLKEVIAAVMGFPKTGVRNMRIYEGLLRELGPELYILREASLSDISILAGEALAEAIRRLRSGEVKIIPGYDGVYGKIDLM